MPRQFRVDVFRLDADGVRVEERSDGTLVIHDAIISRVGVFDYRNADGSLRREYRPDNAVFAPESMRSFEGRPFTNEHPSQNVSPDSFKADAAGSLGDRVYRDAVAGQAVLRVSRINVNDAGTIADIKGGKRELSAGYWADFDPTPGTSPDGEHFNGTQTLIEGNHVALVSRGKAGALTRLPRIDSAEIWQDVSRATFDAFVDGTNVRRGDPPFEVVETFETSAEARAEVDRLHARNDPRAAARGAQARRRWMAWKETKDSKEGSMPKIKHNGIEYDLPDNLAAPIAALTTQSQAETARADKAEGEIEALKLRLSELEARPTFDAAAMQARRELERKADGHLPEGFDLNASDDDIRRAVIAKRGDGFDLENKSSDFIGGIFEMIIKTQKVEDAQRRPHSHRADAAPGNNPLPTPHSGEWTGDDGRARMDAATFFAKADEQLRTIYNPNYIAK